MEQTPHQVLHLGVASLLMIPKVHGLHRPYVVMAASDRENSTSKQVSVGSIDQEWLLKNGVRNAIFGVLDLQFEY